MSASPNLSATARGAWLLVALLMPVALLNYLDRQMLASMKYSVMADVPSIATEENWGFMLGQFKWVYAAFSIIGGYLADRVGRRMVICTSVFVWSSVTWWTGHVHDFHGLLLARSLMGISEAFYMPAALALIADYHTERTRSRAIGLHQMAIYCGVILGGFGGYVAESPSLGWRSAFDACGIFGMLYALPLLLLLPERPITRNHGIGSNISGRSAARELLTNVSFILLVLYFTLPGLFGWIVRDWMPAIFKEKFEIAQGLAGVTSTIYWVTAAIFGAIWGGWLADRWIRRNIRGRIYTSAIGMSFMVPAIFGVGNAGSLEMAVAFLILYGVGWAFFDCNNMPILAQIVRPQLRATGYGIMNFVAISCGGLADWGFGVLRDRHVPLNAIFSLFGSIGIVSIILVLLIRPVNHYSAQEQET